MRWIYIYYIYIYIYGARTIGIRTIGMRIIGMEDNWHDFLNYYGVSYLITLFIYFHTKHNEFLTVL